MSKGGAATTVIVAGGVLVALAVIPGNRDSGSVYKKIWAASLLTVALGVAADFVPEIVGPFAVLVIIAAVANNPGVIGDFVNRGGDSGKSASVGSASETTPRGATPSAAAAAGAAAKNVTVNIPHF